MDVIDARKRLEDSESGIAAKGKRHDKRTWQYSSNKARSRKKLFFPATRDERMQN